MSIVTQTLSYRCAISGTGQDPGTQEQKGNTCLLSITNPIANTRPQACSKYTQTSWTFALPPAPTQGLVLAPPRGPGSVCGYEDAVACGRGSPSFGYL